MTINVLVEIPKGSRNKYEVDKESGKIRLDRVPRVAAAYPGDYGEIPGSHGEDGDPLDVLVITRFPTFPGCLLEARPIALLEMVDTGESDNKVIAVPEKDPYFDSWKNLNDIPESFRKEISYFYATYKELEPGKHVEVKDWKEAKEAEELVTKSQK